MIASGKLSGAESYKLNCLLDAIIKNELGITYEFNAVGDVYSVKNSWHSYRSEYQYK